MMWRSRTNSDALLAVDIFSELLGRIMKCKRDLDVFDIYIAINTINVNKKLCVCRRIENWIKIIRS